MKRRAFLAAAPTLVASLREAAARVDAWPTWKKIMFERSAAAERYSSELHKSIDVAWYEKRREFRP